jgi:ketosteroid isomerase-like protein
MEAAPLANRILEGIEAFNRGDYEAVLSLLSEDVEWKRVDGLPDHGGLIRGRDAVRELLEPQVFSSQRFEPLQIVEDDDKVLVHGLFHARGAGSGIELDVEAYAAYWLDDGLARRVENWTDRADAERSSGLSLGS